MAVSRRSREDLRESIIQASLELGTELGEEGLTMRGIAARLDLSATALYQHFESKAQILREIRYYGLRKLAAMVGDTAAIADPLERLAVVAQRYVEFAKANPWLYTVLMEHEHVEWEDLGAEEVQSLITPLVGVRACLAQCAKAGRVRADLDVDLAAFQLWAAMHGVCSLMISGRISERHPAFPVRDEAGFRDQFISAMIRGVTA